MKKKRAITHRRVLVNFPIWGLEELYILAESDKYIKVSMYKNSDNGIWVEKNNPAICGEILSLKEKYRACREIK